MGVTERTWRVCVWLCMLAFCGVVWYVAGWLTLRLYKLGEL